MTCRISLALLFLGCLCTNANAALYDVTDIGLLPGYVSSTATSVDNQGEVVGYDTASNGSTEAFYWTQAGGLVGLGGTNSEAFGVNNGNVVGIDNNQAFRWTAASGTVLLDPVSSGQANGVNSSGEAIGSRDLGAADRVLTWSPTNSISNPFPPTNLSGVAINDRGQFVGIANGSSGYYDSGATRSNLGAFQPNSLSDNQIIAGATAINGIAALYNVNTSSSTTIGTLSTDTTSNALGINPLGNEIVGISNGHGGFLYNISTSTLSSVTSLLDPSYSGWSILTANSINDSGFIAGQGSLGGVQEAVLLTFPTPEPSSLVLLCVGAFSFWVCRPRAWNARVCP